MSNSNAPIFWEPAKVSTFYQPNILAARAEAIKLKKAGLRSASKQVKEGKRHLLIVIDGQWDFCDDGRLPVKGAFEDLIRLGDRIIEGAVQEYYTDVIITSDAHPEHVIHGETWWVGENGEYPDVTIPLRMKLVDPAKYLFEALFPDGTSSGKYYRPRGMKEHTVKYAQHLIATGQGDIWVFVAHCKQGSEGMAIIPALYELLAWMATARDIQPMYMYKGHIAEVDWFGPFRPCMDVPGHPQGGIQTTYLDMIRECESTEITGWAEDFCVKAGMLQVLDYYKAQPDVLRRIKFIEDTTSAIVPGPELQKFKDEMKSKGIQIIKHDEPLAA